jgi:hypothetical protein
MLYVFFESPRTSNKAKPNTPVFKPQYLIHPWHYYLVLTSACEIQRSDLCKRSTVSVRPRHQSSLCLHHVTKYNPINQLYSCLIWRVDDIYLLVLHISLFFCVYDFCLSYTCFIECILRNNYCENVEVHNVDISESSWKNRGYSIQ